MKRRRRKQRRKGGGKREKKRRGKGGGVSKVDIKCWGPNLRRHSPAPLLYCVHRRMARQGDYTKAWIPGGWTHHFGLVFENKASLECSSPLWSSTIHLSSKVQAETADFQTAVGGRICVAQLSAFHLWGCHPCLGRAEARRGHWNPWSWSSWPCWSHSLCWCSWLLLLLKGLEDGLDRVGPAPHKVQH